jgi:hypothetical protein
LIRHVALALAVLALTAAEAAVAQQPAEQPQPRPHHRQLPSVGDPGRVAATDSSFARTAREQGQWTAFAAYAAPGAVMHWADGPPFEAAPWLATQSNPAEPLAWAPTAVWASCDGTLAVSFGRFRQPDGQVGSYTTVWTLQGEREYRWAYDMGGLDLPQPPPPPPRVPPSDEVIVVPGLGLINGKVADCPRGNAREMPVRVVVDIPSGHSAMADDGTLAWRWEQTDDGSRRIVVDWLRDGRWQTALDFGFAADGTSLRPAQ